MKIEACIHVCEKRKHTYKRCRRRQRRGQPAYTGMDAQREKKEARKETGSERPRDGEGERGATNAGSNQCGRASGMRTRRQGQSKQPTER
eukprot:6202914-Pleurochrysis_carterae.AAC.3